MERMEDNEFIIVDSDGVEEKYEILFTYENEDRNTSYVLYYAPENPDEIYAARYVEETHELFEVETDEEWEEIEEVLNAFQSEDDE